MRRRKKLQKHNTLQLVFVFCVLVFSLLAFSAIAKIGLIVKQSLFDGSHRFTVLVLDKHKKNGDLLSFSSEEKTMSVLHITSKNQINDKTAGILLGVPIDGYMVSVNDYAIKEEKDISTFLQSAVFEFSSFSTNLTIFDTARLWFFAKTTPAYSVKIQKTSAAVDDLTTVDELVIDKIISPLFIDETVTAEKKSIQIVNGTGMLGLGNRFARLVTNMGGDVVAVSTADNLLDKSQIFYYGEKTYTVERLAKLLSCETFPLKQQEISDIIVTLGKDRLESLSN